MSPTSVDAVTFHRVFGRPPSSVAIRKSSIAFVRRSITSVRVWFHIAVRSANGVLQDHSTSTPWVRVEKSLRKNRNTGKLRASAMPSASRVSISSGRSRVSCDSASRSATSIRK